MQKYIFISVILSLLITACKGEEEMIEIEVKPQKPLFNRFVDAGDYETELAKGDKCCNILIFPSSSAIRAPKKYPAGSQKILVLTAQVRSSEILKSKGLEIMIKSGSNIPQFENLRILINEIETPFSIHLMRLSLIVEEEFQLPEKNIIQVFVDIKPNAYGGAKLGLMFDNFSDFHHASTGGEVEPYEVTWEAESSWIMVSED